MKKTGKMKAVKRKYASLISILDTVSRTLRTLGEQNFPVRQCRRTTPSAAALAGDVSVVHLSRCGPRNVLSPQSVGRNTLLSRYDKHLVLFTTENRQSFDMCCACAIMKFVISRPSEHWTAAILESTCPFEIQKG